VHSLLGRQPAEVERLRPLHRGLPLEPPQHLVSQAFNEGGRSFQGGH